MPTQHDLISVVADGSNEKPSLAAADPLQKQIHLIATDSAANQ